MSQRPERQSVSIIVGHPPMAVLTPEDLEQMARDGYVSAGLFRLLSQPRMRRLTWLASRR